MKSYTNASCVSGHYLDYPDMVYSDVPETTIAFEDKGSSTDNETFEIKLTEDD